MANLSTLRRLAEIRNASRTAALAPRPAGDDKKPKPVKIKVSFGHDGDRKNPRYSASLTGVLSDTGRAGVEGLIARQDPLIIVNEKVNHGDLTIIDAVPYTQEAFLATVLASMTDGDEALTSEHRELGTARPPKVNRKKAALVPTDNGAPEDNGTGDAS